jgi:hypothetical protein
MSLSACGIALAQIPPDTDLDELGTLFDTCGDERTALRRALLEERAIGNEIYADYGFRRTPHDPGSETILNTVVSCDQPYFLGVHEQLFACLDRNSTREVAAGLADVQAELERHFESWRKYTTTIAGMILARYAEPWHELIGRRARIELLRAGLRARKLAPDAALDDARRGRDPFSEGNLHGRLDPDGLLTIWSVGPDGKDGGGPSALERERRGIKEADCDDLVIRVRMR